jgi:hypothetical protein
MKCPKCGSDQFRFYHDEPWITCLRCQFEFQVLGADEISSYYFHEDALSRLGIKSDFPMTLEEILRRVREFKFTEDVFGY